MLAIHWSSQSHTEPIISLSNKRENETKQLTKKTAKLQYERKKLDYFVWNGSFFLSKVAWYFFMDTIKVLQWSRTTENEKAAEAETSLHRQKDGKNILSEKKTSKSREYFSG